MIVSKEKYFYDAFVLAQEGLQRLADIFAQSIAQPTFEIECRDGINRRFDDVEGLLSFANGWSTRIQSLWIRSADDERMRRARLRFSSKKVPVYLEISAETEVWTAVDGLVANALREMEPNYLGRGPFDLALAVLAGFAAAVTAFAVLVAVKLLWQASAGAALGPVSVILASEAACFGACIVVAWLVHRPKSPLFPRAVFAVGRGVLRKRLLKVLRGGLFVGLAVALFAVIILNIGT